MAGRAVRRHIRRAALLQTVLVEREKEMAFQFKYSTDELRKRVITAEK